LCARAAPESIPAAAINCGEFQQHLILFQLPARCAFLFTFCAVLTKLYVTYERFMNILNFFELFYVASTAIFQSLF
jgi:hypothetical protein